MTHRSRALRETSRDAESGELGERIHLWRYLVPPEFFKRKASCSDQPPGKGTGTGGRREVGVMSATKRRGGRR
jgi:hypothetical protein